MKRNSLTKMLWIPRLMEVFHWQNEKKFPDFTETSLTQMICMLTQTYGSFPWAKWKWIPWLFQDVPDQTEKFSTSLMKDLLESIEKEMKILHWWVISNYLGSLEVKPISRTKERRGKNHRFFRKYQCVFVVGVKLESLECRDSFQWWKKKRKKK